MPNKTPESDQLQAVKKLIAALSATERSRLRPWILAKYDVHGNDNNALPRGSAQR